MPKFRDPADGSIFEAVNEEAAVALTEAKRRKVSPTQEPSIGEAAGRGLAAGLTRNWSDEISALAAASGLPPITHGGVVAPLVGGARMLMGSEGAGETYETQLAKNREAGRAAALAHPMTSIGSELVGGMIGPGMGGSLPATIGRAALEGGVAGAGAGETGLGRATGAGIGAGIGGAIGGVVGVAAPYLESAWRGITGAVPSVAVRRGEAEGTQDVAEALRRDLGGEGLSMPIGAGRTGQAQEMVLGDLGGQNVLEKARAAANLSPDAWSAIKGATDPRYQSQADRFTEFWGRRSSLDEADKLRAEAGRMNRPAYEAAYAKGATGVWDDRLKQLTGAPEVEKAIKEATGYSRTQAALEGTPHVRNPFTINEDGTLSLPKDAKPTLQFWDHVQRDLRRQAEAAPRGSQEARDINRVRQALNEHLDAAVPEFGAARRGAAGAFGQEDALEAGRSFLVNPASNKAEVKRAFDRMNPAERELFRRGLEENVLEKIRGQGYSRDIAKALDSPEMTERLQMGLGKERYDTFKNYMTVERGMNNLRNALGNSTTAKQLVGLGLVGAGGGIAGTGLTADSNMLTGAGALTMLRGVFKRGNAQISTAAANRIAALITSQDDAAMEAVLKAMQNNPAVRKAVSNGFALIENVLSQQAGGIAGEESR